MSLVDHALRAYLTANPVDIRLHDGTRAVSAALRVEPGGWEDEGATVSVRQLFGPYSNDLKFDRVALYDTSGAELEQIPITERGSSASLPAGIAYENTTIITVKGV